MLIVASAPSSQNSKQQTVYTPLIKLKFLTTETIFSTICIDISNDHSVRHKSKITFIPQLTRKLVRWNHTLRKY